MYLFSPNLTFKRRFLILILRVSVLNSSPLPPLDTWWSILTHTHISPFFFLSSLSSFNCKQNQTNRKVNKTVIYHHLILKHFALLKFFFLADIFSLTNIPIFRIGTFSYITTTPLLYLIKINNFLISIFKVFIFKIPNCPPNLFTSSLFKLAPSSQSPHIVLDCVSLLYFFEYKRTPCFFHDPHVGEPAWFLKRK